MADAVTTTKTVAVREGRHPFAGRSRALMDPASWMQRDGWFIEFSSWWENGLIVLFFYCQHTSTGSQLEIDSRVALEVGPFGLAICEKHPQSVDAALRGQIRAIWEFVVEGHLKPAEEKLVRPASGLLDKFTELAANARYSEAFKEALTRAVEARGKIKS